MRLDKIILNNFLTYDNLEYNFEQKPLLVQGINLTDENQKSNGTGKSAMQTGIEFCITATNSRDVRDLDLVSYGQKEARAQLFVSCDVRKETIHIDWTIKVKGSNKLSLYKLVDKEEDLWEEVSFSNVNDGKKWILNWFDISKEDLFSYFIINKSRFKSFFKSSNKEKVDLINRFSDASIIEGLENIDNSELELDASIKQADINKVEGKIEMIQTNLFRQENRDLEAERKAEVEELNENIDDLRLKIEDKKMDLNDERQELAEDMALLKKSIKTYSDINDTLAEANKALDNFTEIDYSEKLDDLEEEIDSLEEDIDLQNEFKKDWETKQYKVDSLLSQINAKLSGSITCPSCNHEFVLEGDIEELKNNKDSALSMIPKINDKIEDCKKEIGNLEAKSKLIEGKISEIEKKIEDKKSEKRSLLNTVDEILAKLRNEKTKIDNLERGQRRYESAIEDIERDIKNHENEIKEIEAEIKGLKTSNNEDLITTLKEDLSSLELTKTTLNKELSDINDKIYLRNQWKVNFKKFRGYLANQSLEVMQYHCNRYLVDMKSDLRVKFEGFKELANGSLKDEISAKVIRNGERSFSSFSGGERARLLFASILANRHMINKTHKYGGLDFLSIDEVLEGADSVGLQQLMKSIRGLNITAMVITHVSDENASSDVLTIVKENGISKIKE